MTLTLATNSQNDIFIGADGSLALQSGINAVSESARQAASALLGEMAFAADRGVPFFDVAFPGNYNVAQFEAYARLAISQTPGVLEIREFEAAAVAGVLTYRVAILTTFGEALLNG